MVLTKRHKDILQAKICPYCDGKPEFVDSKEVYGRSYGFIYLCRACDAYVGVHKGTKHALGRLANKQLRTWKKAAHRAFDPIWKDGYMSRSEAYEWLSRQVGLPPEYTHIGMFSSKTCRVVIERSKAFLKFIK